MKRIRLPDTRRGSTSRVSIAGYDVYITVNFYENNQPGELFATVGKEGSTLCGVIDTLAIMVSMLLQTGVPAAVIAQKLMHTRFEPADEKHTSLADALGKTLLKLTSDWGGVPDKDNEGT